MTLLGSTITYSNSSSKPLCRSTRLDNGSLLRQSSLHKENLLVHQSVMLAIGRRLRHFPRSIWMLHVGVPVGVFLVLLLSYPYTPKIIQNIIVDRPSSCRTASVFRCEHCIPELSLVSTASNETAEHSGASWTFDLKRDERNYGLTDSQCDIAFPGLFEDIDVLARRRLDSNNPITKKELDRAVWPKATLRGMIYDNELYILNYTKPQVRGVKHEATLHALHRAVLTSPAPLPNVEFAMTFNDFAQDSQLIWSYTRTADDNDTWLMPDFGFWGWGETGSNAALGSWTQTRRWMREVEQRIGAFSAKIPKVFWRGEVMMAERLRTDLLAYKDRSWADMKHVRFRTESFDRDSLPLHEHCKYMFLIHTEGNSYSGRLKHLQNCHSVIFAHQMRWIQPFEYLMVSSGPKQNYVEVKRDWSDLPEKVEYYLEHLDEAERIASNSVATFRDRYQTPAAETCYWRKLIHGWRKVSFEPEFYDYKNAPEVGMHWRGTPFENYALRRHRDFVLEQGTA